MEAELFNAGIQVDRHDEANSRFSHFTRGRKNRFISIQIVLSFLMF